MWMEPPITLDTNVAIYAFTDEGEKAATAQVILERAEFVSVQLLNEFANVALRKQGRPVVEVAIALDRLRLAVPRIVAIDTDAHLEALRLVSRYQMSFYDALMLGVALSSGARTFYSEDMQHGMAIDETLRVVNPFLPGALG